jgi:hypothetical protein
LLTLADGSEVGVFFLEVAELSTLTQLELKYTEAFDGLNYALGYGPWTYANGLANTFRTETLISPKQAVMNLTSSRVVFDGSELN